MPYATRAQIEARLPSVLTADEIFDATVAEALAWADTKINGALAHKYYTPFNPVPASIAQLAADFAAVFCMRSFTESEPSQTAAERLLEEAKETLASMLENGVPELVESGDDVPPAISMGYHSALGQTSQIVKMEWP